MVVTDLQAVSQWPRYAPVALESDFHAVAGIPMFGGGLVVGALNCYATQTREWSKDDLDAPSSQLRRSASSTHAAYTAPTGTGSVRDLLTATPSERSCLLRRPRASS